MPIVLLVFDLLNGNFSLSSQFFLFSIKIFFNIFCAFPRAVCAEIPRNSSMVMVISASLCRKLPIRENNKNSV
jgi:hypothetical protein